MIPPLEGLPTKAKEAPSPYEVRLAPLDTNPVFQCLGDCISYVLTSYQCFAVSLSMSGEFAMLY